MDEEGWSWGVKLVAASTYNDLVWVIEREFGHVCAGSEQEY